MVHQKLHALDQVAERTINAVGDGERAICSNPECGTSLWNDYYFAPATEKEVEAWQKQKEEEKAAKGGGKAAMAAAAPAAKGLDDDDDDDDEEEEEEEEEGQGPPDTELCPDCFIRRVQAMQETMDADQEEVDFVKSLKRCGLEPASRFDAALQLPLPKHTEPATLPRLPLAKKVLQRGERIADMPSICTPVSNINPGEEGSPEVDNTSNVVLASLPADAAKLHKNIFSPTMWQMRHGIEGEPEPSNLRTADGVKYGPQFVERTNPEMFAAFHKRWMQGEPILMRRCIGRMSWAPRVLRRMARESRPGQTRQEGNSLTIIRCSDICEMTGMQVGEFFTNYLQGGVKRKNGVRELLKLKDWPPNGDMRDFAPRHTADFYEMCPVPEYTNPKGPFNVVSLFPQNFSQPDLGPKCYIAFGSPDEAPCEGKNGFEDRGDSVTKMHYDMADAVNLLVHVQSDAMVKAQEEGERDFSNLPCQHDEVGAVWDLFHRNDAAKLELWIKEKAAEGRWYHGPNKVVLTATQNETDAAVPDETATQNETDAAMPDESVLDHPIHDQLVYLRKDDLALLKQETGIVPWRIYQREGDAVFVPSRCPHQVRNLRPCVKIAVDFVSVENAQFAVDLADDYRGLKQGHAHKEDVLQARAVAMHAWAAAEALATGGAGAR
ncbi:lysine-specific demethylase JMJ25 [Pseudoscourfieldia marina]